MTKSFIAAVSHFLFGKIWIRMTRMFGQDEVKLIKDQ